jgi:hypothetical protein
MNVAKDHPAGAVGLVQTLVNSIIFLCVAFAWVSWSDMQIVGVSSVANAAIAIGGYLWTKRNTTSLSNPKDKEGTPLVPAKPDLPVTRGLDQ